VDFSFAAETGRYWTVWPISAANRLTDRAVPGG